MKLSDYFDVSSLVSHAFFLRFLKNERKKIENSFITLSTLTFFSYSHRYDSIIMKSAFSNDSLRGHSDLCDFLMSYT